MCDRARPVQGQGGTRPAKQSGAFAAYCICLFSLAGCNDPGMNIAVQPFVTYPMTAESAYKIRFGISDTKDDLLGLTDVAIGLDLEFSSFEDADGETWTYMRAGIPLIASTRNQNGWGDHAFIRGWPAVPEDKQKLFLRGAVEGPAWFLGFSLKYLRSDNEEILALGPNLAYEAVRQVGSSPMGWGYSFEVDTGLDVRNGDPYGSVSLGLLMVFGGPTRW